MRRFLLVGWLIPAYLSSTSSALAQSVSLGANFTTMTVRDVQNGTGTFLVPPDSTGAVGPNHFVQYNNGGLAIFYKDGSSVSGFLSETAFWRDRVGFTQTQADLAGGDPRLFFDPLSGRYFAVAFTTPSGSIGNQIYVARSDSADPNGSWKGVSFTPSTTLFADFPTLGVDRNGLYVATNNFSLSGATFTFNRVDVFSLPKADLLLAAPTAANRTNFNGTSTGTVTQAVNNFSLGQTSSTSGLLLSGNILGAELRVTSVNNSGGAGATLSSTE